MSFFKDSSLSDFKPHKIIGYGKFSTVINAYYNNNNNNNKGKSTLVAIKIITKIHKNKKLNNLLPISSSSTNYDTEINIIKKISIYNHPNLLNYFIIFNTNLTIYIIQEFSKIGELNPSNFKYNLNSNIEISMINKLIDMLSAINFLHSINIIHRDIKPSNFLVFQNGLVKLTDFDTCYNLTNDLNNDKLQLYSKLIGTPLFLPPELLTHSTTNKTSIIKNDSIITKKSKFTLSKEPFIKLFNKKSTTTTTNINNNNNIDQTFNPFMLDLWSLGVTLHYLFYSNYPFYADNEFTLLHRIATAVPETPTLNNLSFKINSEFKLIKIINNLLIKSPIKRWSIDDILNDLNYNDDNNNNKSNYKLNKFKSVNLNNEILIKNSDNNDLLISDLSNYDDDDLSFENLLDSNLSTNNNNNNNNNNSATQKVKFQLPIFMSPKDVRSSHLIDYNNDNNNKFRDNNNVIIDNDIFKRPNNSNLHELNENNNSSSSLPLNTSKSLHYKNKSNIRNKDIKLSSNFNMNNNINNNLISNDDLKTANDYAIIMKKLESLPCDSNNNINDISKNLKNDNNNNKNKDNRSSVHTLPANFNLKSVKGSYKGLKHSEIMNFKKFIDNSDSNIENDNIKNDSTKKLITKPSYNALDKQLVNDYKLYTMDDYLDSL